jgi:ketosteroid isomerase-like protein
VTDAPNLALARAYLAALQSGASGLALKGFLADDFQQTEYPNKLNPKGQASDLAQTMERLEKGKAVLRSQRYDVRSAIGNGDSVALEVDWTGVLAIPLAGLPAGGELHAHFAMFMEFRGGKITRQRNYDCFQPWE